MEKTLTNANLKIIIILEMFLLQNGWFIEAIHALYITYICNWYQHMNSANFILQYHKICLLGLLHQFQHFFGHILSDGLPNWLSWLTNQQSPISGVTAYLFQMISVSVAKDKWPLVTSSIVIGNNASLKDQTSPAGLQIKFSTYWANWIDQQMRKFTYELLSYL